MELWEILDEFGNPTGETIRNSDPKVWYKGIYHSSADVWIINSNNEILIQKRAASKKFQPNVWAMTGGNIRYGETALETLKRETYEELGIKLETQNAIKITRYKTLNVWVDEYVVMQDINLEDITMQVEEVSEVKWASFDEIEKIFRDGMFIKERWEFVRDKISDYINNKR